MAESEEVAGEISGLEPESRAESDELTVPCLIAGFGCGCDRVCYPARPWVREQGQMNCLLKR